jgi:membrane carboxypeptidase/penicillin-binding protein
MSNEFIEEPEPGCDIVTTIDIHLQDVAHAALRRQLEQHRMRPGDALFSWKLKQDLCVLSQIFREIKETGEYGRKTQLCHS